MSLLISTFETFFSSGLLAGKTEKVKSGIRVLISIYVSSSDSRIQNHKTRMYSSLFFTQLPKNTDLVF